MKNQIAAAFAAVESPGVHIRPIVPPPLPRWFVFGLGLVLGVVCTLGAVILITQ